MTTLSYLLGHSLGWGVYGMWVGINIGQASAFVLYLIMYSCMDLSKIQKETKERLEVDQRNAKSFIEITQEIDEKKLVNEKRAERFMSFDEGNKSFNTQETPENMDV